MTQITWIFLIFVYINPHNLPDPRPIFDCDLTSLS